MTAYLLDTNVVSESAKRSPSPAVLGWLDRTNAELVYLSVLTLGELRKGAEKIRGSSPVRADALEAWLAATASDYGSRVVPVDALVADQWGRLSAGLASTPVESIDALIAATALVHGLTVVTRNVRHFEPTGVPTLDPFATG